MVDRFPVIKAGYIFNKIPAKLNNSYKLVHKAALWNFGFLLLSAAPW